jgi:uncharacterized protein (DUF433 family)
MYYKNRIAVSPNIMLGKPCIKGTRITVELIIKKMSEGAAIDDLLKGYPKLTEEDIRSALAYSADVISREELLAS